MGERLDYPNDFDTATFPAGKGIALSRRLAIYISVIFFFVLCACGFVIFFTRLKTSSPFLISVDQITNEWTLVAYPGKNTKDSVEQYEIIQEKLVADYVTNWFTISHDNIENGMRWAQCSTSDCSLPEQFNPNNKKYALCCASDPELFEQFKQKVLSEYMARVQQASEQWTVEKLDILPEYVVQNGGLWRVYLKIHSNVNGYFDVLTFVEINRSSTDLYPVTLGYYVKDFNAYRINQ